MDNNIISNIPSLKVKTDKKVIIPFKYSEEINENDIFSKKYIKYLNENSNVFKLNNKSYQKGSQFAYYLAGLLEGDGSIFIPSSLHNKKNVYPVIKITFAEKDFPLADKLFLLLPFGKLYKERGKYYNLVFYKLNAIFLIVYLINGKMRTPKMEALNRLIDWFNLKYNINLEKLNIDTSDIGKNAWLSGFLDCDSCFSCFFNINKTGIAKDIHCYMRLSQRQYYNIKNSTTDINNNESVDDNQKLGNNSYFHIMEKIRIFLNVNNLRIIKRIKKNNFIESGYEIRTSKKESNNILINYFNNYPLYSSKYLDYLDWKSMLKIKNNREYKEKEGTKLLIFLKSGLNNSRTNFSWEHLNNFWRI